MRLVHCFRQRGPSNGRSLRPCGSDGIWTVAGLASESPYALASYIRPSSAFGGPTLPLVVQSLKLKAKLIGPDPSHTARVRGRYRWLTEWRRFQLQPARAGNRPLNVLCGRVEKRRWRSVCRRDGRHRRFKRPPWVVPTLEIPHGLKQAACRQGALGQSRIWENGKEPTVLSRFSLSVRRTVCQCSD